MFKRLLVAGVALASASAWIAYLQARTVWRKWGIDPAEASVELPGDDLVSAAMHVETRGIDIAASPAAVWPWLVQMGYGRAGWYSYDGLDMDRPSVDRIVPELQHLDVGDILPTHPGGGFAVKVIEPEHAIVVYADRALVESQATATPGGLESAAANVRVTGAYLDKAVSGDFEASWAFVVQPKDGGSRLIERFRVRMDPGMRTNGQKQVVPDVARNLLGFGVFVMLRRQMLGIRDRAEGRPIRHGVISRTMAPRFAPKPA